MFRSRRGVDAPRVLGAAVCAVLLMYLVFYGQHHEAEHIHIHPPSAQAKDTHHITLKVGDRVQMVRRKKLKRALKTSDAIAWEESYLEYGGMEGRVEGLDGDGLVEVAFRGSVAWFTKECVAKVLPQMLPQTVRTKKTPPPISHEEPSIEPTTLSECFSNGATLCNVAIGIAESIHPELFLAAVSIDTVADKFAQKVIQLRKEGGQYTSTPYTLQSRFGSFFAIAALDGKAAFDRMEPKSFEHFGVVDGGEGEGLKLFTQCVPPVCKTTIRRYLAFEKDTAKLFGATEKHQAAELQLYKIKHCGRLCSESYLKKSRTLSHRRYSTDAKLILFSTIKPKDRWSPDDSNNIRASLTSWQKIPNVAPYVFTDDSPTRKYIKTEFKGMHIPSDPHLLSMLPFNDHKIHVPTYKSLFLSARDVSEEGDVLCYTNGDMLFTSALSETVFAVKRWLKRRGGSEFMIVGRRFNHVVTEPVELEGEDWEEKVEGLKGKQWQEDAIDYFVVSRDIWKWKNIPEMVVGGTAFDNWVLQHALTTPNVEVIDATYTITAIHQTNKGESLFASHESTMSSYNHKLGEKNGGWAKGKVTQAPYITLISNGSVVVHERGVVTAE